MLSVRRNSRTVHNGRLYLLLVLLAMLGALATAVPASAATGPEARPAAGRATVAPSNVHDRQDCSAHLCLSVRFDGFFGYNVKQMAAWLPDADRKGHFEFFGPAGHIANSADRVWHINETYEINGLWTGNAGALWCVRFWVYNAATRHWGTISGNYCIRS
jgi:hypothetical protein